MKKFTRNIGDPRLNLYSLLFKEEKLEKEYRETNAERHFLSQRLLLLAGILLFASFGFYDFSVQTYSLEEILIARIGIFTPILATIWIISTVKYGKKIFNILASLIVIFCASGIIYIISLSPFHIADNYTYGLVLALIFGFILIDIYFLTSILNYIIISFIYFLILSQKDNIPPEYFSKQTILFVSLGLTLIIGRYTIEFYKRIDFLTRKQLELEKTKVKKSFQREKCSTMQKADLLM